jgi:hypothetical protein
MSCLAELSYPNPSGRNAARQISSSLPIDYSFNSQKIEESIMLESTNQPNKIPIDNEGEPEAKLPYSPPKLCQHGKINEVTLTTSSGFRADGGGFPFNWDSSLHLLWYLPFGVLGASMFC